MSDAVNWESIQRSSLRGEHIQCLWRMQVCDMHARLKKLDSDDDMELGPQRVNWGRAASLGRTNRQQTHIHATHPAPPVNGLHKDVQKVRLCSYSMSRQLREKLHLFQPPRADQTPMTCERPCTYERVVDHAEHSKLLSASCPVWISDIWHGQCLSTLLQVLLTRPRLDALYIPCRRARLR